MQRDLPETDGLSGVHLWLVLWKAYRAVAGVASESIRQTGLGDSDFRVLELLLHKGPTPVNTIGPKVQLTPGSISVAIDRLEEKGLVRRRGDPEDRRVRVVELTPEGRGLILPAFQRHATAMEALAGVLSAQERRTLLRLLKKFGEAARTE
jgi:MarR family 2-MHQ and catechol resistance regulon transcriptional repressor